MHPISRNPVLANYGMRGKGFSAPDNIIIKSLKAVHLLCATAWGGGALGMQALSFLRLTTPDAALATHVGACIHAVDTYVVIPGLVGCALSGLFYSLFTAIGFFRYAWIGYKWLMTLCAGFWGLVFWSGAGDRMLEWLAPHGLDWPLRFVRGFILPENVWQGGLQIAVILSMCLISVYRPLSLRHRANFSVWKMR